MEPVMLDKASLRPVSICVSEYEAVRGGYRFTCKLAENPDVALGDLMGREIVVGATGLMCGAVPARFVDHIYRVYNILIPRGLVEQVDLLVHPTHRKVR